MQYVFMKPQKETSLKVDFKSAYTDSQISFQGPKFSMISGHNQFAGFRAAEAAAMASAAADSSPPSTAESTPMVTSPPPLSTAKRRLKLAQGPYLYDVRKFSAFYLDPL